MKKILMLNSSYLPIKTITWQRTMSLLFLDKIEIISSYEDWFISSSTKKFNVPCVVRLKNFQELQKQQGFKFSRNNIFKRDNFYCLYCGAQFKESKLTIDHVIPKSLGGDTSWENIVSCCKDCNKLKSNKTPQQAKMKLLKIPKKPENFAINKTNIIYSVDSLPQEWELWLK